MVYRYGVSGIYLPVLTKGRVAARLNWACRELKKNKVSLFVEDWVQLPFCVGETVRMKQELGGWFQHLTSFALAAHVWTA